MKKKKINTKSEKELEDLCIRCGACCGSMDGDPCEHLWRDIDNKYFCEIYHNRLGAHKTIYGTKLECVPITEKLHEDWIGQHNCPYKKLFLCGKLKV